MVRIHYLRKFNNENFTICKLIDENSSTYSLLIRNETTNTILTKIKSKDVTAIDSLLKDIRNIKSYTELMDWLLEVTHIEDNNILASLKGYGKY